MTLASNAFSATIAASLFAAPAYAESQIFDFTGFDQISIEAGIEANIVSGPEFSIRAEAPSLRVLQKLDIEMRGQTLYATRKSNLRDFFFGSNAQISLTITLPVLREISIESGVDARVSGQFDQEFAGSAASGALLDIENLTSNTIDISAASGARINIDGTCRILDLSVSSGALVDTKELVCSAVEVSASSGATARVFAQEVLDSSVSSGASVNVYGSPDQTDISNSSGGSTNIRN